MKNKIPATYRNKRKVQQYSKRIYAAWGKVVDSIIEVGNELIEAHKNLDYSDYKLLVEQLPFGTRTAERLRGIAADKRLTKKSMRKRLPPYWSTIHEISRMSDEELNEAKSKGLIKPTVTRKQVNQFRAVQRTTNGNDKSSGATGLTFSIPYQINESDALLDLMFIAELSRSIFSRSVDEPAIGVLGGYPLLALKHSPHIDSLKDILDAELKVSAALIEIWQLVEAQQKKKTSKTNRYTGRSEMLTILGVSKEELEQNGGLYRTLMSKRLQNLGLKSDYKKLVSSEKLLKSSVKKAKNKLESL